MADPKTLQGKFLLDQLEQVVGGLTQKATAKRIGIPNSSITRIKNGELDISPETKVVLLDYLFQDGRDPSEFERSSLQFLNAFNDLARLQNQENDAISENISDEAKTWLLNKGYIDEEGSPTKQLVEWKAGKKPEDSPNMDGHPTQSDDAPERLASAHESQLVVDHLAKLPEEIAAALSKARARTNEANPTAADAPQPRSWHPYLDLPDPRPDQPSGEDHESRYKYYVQATKIIGRDEEEALLAAFADTAHGFRWSQVAGVAGQGKTRLAYELALTRAKDGWTAGFLARDDLPRFAAEAPEWTPDRPYLILIDYAIGQEEAIGCLMGALVKRRKFPHPVRVLILERQRWDRGRIDQITTTTSEGGIEFSYANERADWFELVEKSAVADLTSSDRAAPLIELTKIRPEKLLEIVRAFAPSTETLPDKTIQDRLKKIDPDGRPLFALFYAEALSDSANADKQSWTKTELLDYILRRNRKRRWSAIFTGEPPNIGDDTPALRLALLATLTHGARRTEAGEYLQTADGSNLEREALALLDAPIGSSPRFFPPLLPDLLGGWFVIDSMRAGLDIAPMLLAAWEVNPPDTAAVLRRIAADFAEIPEALALFEVEPEGAEARSAYLSANAAACSAVWTKDIVYTAQQIERLEAASDAQDGEASDLLGLIHHYGNGVKANVEMGARYFEKGAVQRSDRARDNWGLSLLNGIRVPKDPARAKKLFEKGVGKDRNRSRALLAHLLLRGPEDLQDHKRAIVLLKNAADAGDASGMFNLGVCYERGEGVGKDPVKAAKWYRKAADACHADGMFNLGVCYERDEGVEQDPVKAVKWYRKAADAGHASGMFNLGGCYMRGEGVERDPVEAAKWYRKAADADDASGMFNLGLCHQRGEGVERDPVEAAKWYRKAADAGDASGMVYLGGCYKRGEGVKEDPVKAVKWYRNAADAGHADGMFNLGVCYMRGEGVEKDPVKAAKWYRKATYAGDGSARAHLAALAALVAGIDPPQTDPDVSRAPLIEPGAPWVDPPPIPAAWDDAKAEEAMEIMAKIGVAAGWEGQPHLFEGLCVTALRRADLDCWPGLTLADVQIEGGDGPRLISALISGHGAVLLSGEAFRLHTANAAGLSLDRIVDRTQHLRLFCQFVHGDEGPYALIDALDDIPFTDDAAKAALLDGGVKVTPPEIVGTAGPPYRIKAHVLYGGALYAASFAIQRNGDVAMLDDEQIAKDLPLRRRRYDGFFRTPLQDP